MSRTNPGLPRAASLALAGWALTAALEAQAQEATEPTTLDSKEAALELAPLLSLDPSSPNAGSLPGGMTPSYGQAATSSGDWRFDFHGYLTIPLVAGLNTREEPREGQSKRVLHAPPVVPDDKETFSHTGVVPTPYTQLSFSYGNDIITGNVILVAEQPTISQGFFDPPSQAGINDAFLAFHPDLGDRLRLRAYVGAFSSRYGIMGERDQGRYGTPLIAQLNGVGENVALTTVLARDWLLEVEQGILGSSTKAGPDIVPAGWNDFADSNVGTTFAHHVHAGLSYRGKITLGGHYIYAWSQDDRGTGGLLPDGSVSVVAGDLRLSLGRFGHLYAAVSHTDAAAATTVGQVIEVLNTRGGPGLVDNYFGDDSQGYGELLTYGGQYDLSIGRLVSYPVPFNGDGPDLFVSAFGFATQVDSYDQRFDGINKAKWGGLVTYSLLSWLAVSTRYDQVYPNLDEQRYAFSVLSPQLIFRSDWEAADQVVLGYSHWFNGSLTTVRTGYPPQEDPLAIPDEDVVSLSASMWW